MIEKLRMKSVKVDLYKSTSEVTFLSKFDLRPLS